MIVVRTITSGEAGTFLQVLCTVFELEYARVQPFFFTEPGFDIGRKWALFSEGAMVSVLTTTPLEFGFGKAIGIAGVATLSEARGRGFAGRLLRAVLSHGEAHGEPSALLFAQHPMLYARHGFEVVDEVVHGLLVAEPVEPSAELPFPLVQQRYREWASADPGRLRRTEPRWGAWRMNLKVTEGIGDGYVTYEGTTVREAILPSGLAAWPVPAGTEWIGLRHTTDRLGVPVHVTATGMVMMARRTPAPVTMFMTDQF